MPNIKFELSYDLDTNWNNLVKDNNGFFISSSLWAEFHNKLWIWRWRYLKMYNNDELIFIMLIYENLIWWVLLLKYFPKFVLDILFKIPFFISFSFRLSPLLIKEKPLSKDLYKYYLIELIKYLINIADKEKKNIWPSDFMFSDDLDFVKDIHIELKKLYNDIDLQLSWTVRVNPSDCKKELDWSSKRRNDFKKTQNKWVIVRQVKWLEFYEYLKNSWKKYWLAVNPKIYYDKLINLEWVKFFVAYLWKDITAGSWVMYFGNTCLEFSMFISEYEKKSRTWSGDFLKYHIIEDCIKNDINIWDLNMIDVSENSEKTRNINFYKLKWWWNIVYWLTLFKLNMFLKLVQILKKFIFWK